MCPIVTVAPLSHRTDLKRKFDVLLYVGKDNVKKDCIAQMQLIQPICKVDLGEYLGFISTEKQAEIMDAFLEMIGHECE
jgi:mRNA interferase MazF